jgi:hypothetical protein
MRKTIAALIFVTFFVGCTEATIKSDSKFADDVMSRFKEDITIEDVRNELSDFRTDLEFYNECTKNFEFPVTPCQEGYNCIITIPLPGNHWWLGKGDAQLYFYFNSEQRLTEYMHELYYPRYH